MDDADLVPVLNGQADRTDAVRFWQWNRAAPNYTHNAALRDGPWKLVRPYVTRADPAGDSKVAPVLYNLATDAGESIDLARQEPARYQQMRAALEAWSRDVERERTR